MKKILTLSITFIFILTTMGFALTQVQKPKNILLNGVIVAHKKSIKLKTPTVTYELIGKTKELQNSNGRAVQLKGNVINKKFKVQSFIYIRTCGTPVTITKDPAAMSLVGKLVTNIVEGIHYELQVNNEVYVLTGNSADLSSFNGKMVKITGYALENQISIYQRGIILNVKTVELAPDATTSATTPTIEKSEVLVGQVMIDKFTGAHIGFKSGDILYGLTGKTDGIEAYDGQKVQITGYAPKLVYIRKPDFIIFNVNEYLIVK